ncbi:HAD-like domain-containing protein [Aspergillus floccosus]
MPPNHDKLQALMATKDWIGFDLDDTLHEFRAASHAASARVFRELHRDYEIPLQDLDSSYRRILSQKTAGAFADGKTSSDYRRERFTALMRSHGVAPSEDYLEHLLSLYKSSLATSLVLKPGSLELLRNLKTLKKKIIVVTEGPRDAQEWTLQQLGLSEYVDILVTSNELRRSKMDGLIGETLRIYGIPAVRMVYIGDNYIRDVVPAREEGILAVHLDESGVGLDAGDETIRASSLVELRQLFNA